MDDLCNKRNYFFSGGHIKFIGSITQFVHSFTEEVNSGCAVALSDKQFSKSCPFQCFSNNDLAFWTPLVFQVPDFLEMDNYHWKISTISSPPVVKIL